MTRLIAQPIATSSIRTTPDRPADRVQQVEEDDDHDREAGLAGGEGDRPRRVGAEQDGEREDRPEQPGVGADREDEQPADDDPDHRCR